MPSAICADIPRQASQSKRCSIFPGSRQRLTITLTSPRAASVVDEPKARALLRDAAHLIFEGAQGVLLDEHFGFHPHTTWSTTTFANAQTLLSESGFEGRQTRLGVLRTYFTRHGPGPFVTEDSQCFDNISVSRTMTTRAGKAHFGSALSMRSRLDMRLLWPAG